MKEQSQLPHFVLLSRQSCVKDLRMRSVDFPAKSCLQDLLRMLSVGLLAKVWRAKLSMRSIVCSIIAREEWRGLGKELLWSVVHGEEPGRKLYSVAHVAARCCYWPTHSRLLSLCVTRPFTKWEELFARQPTWKSAVYCLPSTCNLESSTESVCTAGRHGVYVLDNELLTMLSRIRAPSNKQYHPFNCRSMYELMGPCQLLQDTETWDSSKRVSDKVIEDLFEKHVSINGIQNHDSHSPTYHLQGHY